MENIEKCLAIALKELGQLSFRGAAVIPAGRAMDALYLAAQELKNIKAKESEDRGDKDKEGTDG